MCPGTDSRLREPLVHDPLIKLDICFTITYLSLEKPQNGGKPDAMTQLVSLDSSYCFVYYKRRAFVDIIMHDLQSCLSTMRYSCGQDTLNC